MCGSIGEGVDTARDIAQEQEEDHAITEEKPVQKAVEEFAAGKYKMGNHPKE